MTITKGTDGSRNWGYQINPLYCKLEEDLDYSENGGGIGMYAHDYGNPENVYIWIKPCVEAMGYTNVNSAGEINGNVQLTREIAYKLDKSTATVHIQTYKWAIARIKNYLGQSNMTALAVYRNINGEVVQSAYGQPDMHTWSSKYLSPIYKYWVYGASKDDMLVLRELGQTYNQQYENITFDCLTFDDYDDNFVAMKEYLLGSDVYPDEDYSHDENDDPYNQRTPASQPGGGTGKGRTADIVDEPDLPGISGVGTGFVSLYKANVNQLRGLAAKLWSDDFFDNIIKNFQSPMDAVLSLCIAPISPSGSSATIWVGNYNTNVTADKLSQQYVSYDLGSVQINEDIGCYLDYSPYTKLTLYLPYVGFITLDTDQYMNTEISVKYHIDLLTGACVAYIFKNGYIQAQHAGNMFTPIPISGRDMGELYKAVLDVGLKTGAAVSTGGLSAALDPTSLASSASTIMSAKDRVQVGSNIQGSPGLIGIQQAYIIIESPNYCVPSNQKYYTGYPSYMTVKLSSLSGYTEVDSIHLEGIPCTGDELEEIERLLKGGVLL